MKITGRDLALVSVPFLLLYTVVAFVVWYFADSDHDYGLLASMFAASAGTAALARLVFGLPEYREYAPGAVRSWLLGIAAVTGLLSAVYWVADEADNIWLYIGIILPVLVIGVLLERFVDKVDKERTKQGGER